MTPADHIKHAAPLAWLACEKLHKGVSLADRVRVMRKRRRRAPVEQIKVDVTPAVG